MKKILIGTHGRFGEELVNSARMIIGELEDIKVFSLMEQMSIEEYIDEIELSLKDLPSETLCMVDLYAGTPCTAFTMLSEKYNNIVVTGLNLAMLIEVYSQRDYLDSLELADCALDTLASSGRNVTKELRGN